MTPQRIQLSRKKGWRMPADTVKVSRPGQWGNPVAVNTEGWVIDAAGHKRAIIVTPRVAVAIYRDYIEALLGKYPDLFLTTLRGKNLACWCPRGQPCHADVLLELANR